MLCRGLNVNVLAENFFGPTAPAAILKKPKIRRFPMIAGTWTGGEAQNQGNVFICLCANSSYLYEHVFMC